MQTMNKRDEGKSLLLTKYKWLGLTIMLAAVITIVVSGMLAFIRVLTTQEAYTIASWVFFPGLIGWGLHMVVVLKQRKEKQRANKT